MFVVEDFLNNLEPFDYTGGEERFLEELMKVPNYREVLESEIKNNPVWLEAAEKTRDENGYHVFFYLDHYRYDSGKKCVNELALRVFSEGTHPTIKVKVYDIFNDTI